MDFTTADLALTDDVRAQHHSSETGYDYDENSDTIEAIHALVESNHASASNPMQEAIMPTASTRYLVDTSYYTFSSEDIEAYSNKYPQNAANPSDRRAIIEKMRQGTSTLPQSEQESSPSTDFSSSPTFPRFPSVSAYNYRLKSRSASGLVMIRSEPNFDSESVMLDNPDVKLRIVDYLVGGTLFNFVEFENPVIEQGKEIKSAYVERATVESDSGESEFARHTYYSNLPQRSGSSPSDWRGQTLDTPYFEPYNLTWRVSVEVEVQGQNRDDQQILEAGFYKGIEKILKSENKRSDRQYIQSSLVNIGTLDRPAQAIEWYQDVSRPNSPSLKVLVQIPDVNLKTLEDKPDETEQYVHQASYTPEEIGPLIAEVSDKISKMQKEIDSYEGKVVSFAAKREASELLNVMTHLKVLFQDNGIEAFSGNLPSQYDYYINFRATSDYSPVSVHFVERSVDGSLRLRLKADAHFEKYKKASPIESKRTQKILFNLKSIRTSLRSGMRWSAFLASYVDYDKVNLIPKDEAQETSAKKSPAAARQPLVKTSEMFAKENVYMKDEEVIERKAEERKNKAENNKGGLFNQFDFKKTREQIPTTSKELYDFYLNNIHIKNMMLAALDCLVTGQIGQNFDKIVNDVKVLKKDVYDPLHDHTKSVIDAYKDEENGGKWSATKKAFEPLTMFFPDELPVDDMSAAFVKVLKKQLARIINQIIFQLLKNTIDSLINFCAERDRVSRLPDPSDIPGLAIMPDFEALQSMIDGLFNIDVPVDRLSDLVADVSTLLSARELCQLLKGEPTPEVLRIVRALIDSSYCELGLDSDGKVIDFFSEIGNSMDLGLCDELIGPQPEGELEDDDLTCPPDSQLRNDLLSGNGLTDEQIQRQLEQEREIAKKLARQMLDQVKDGVIQAPNPFCTRDANGNIQAGHTSFMDAQFAYTIRTTFEKTFENIYIAFNREGSEFSQNLIGLRDKYMYDPKMEVAKNRPEDIYRPVKDIINVNKFANGVPYITGINTDPTINEDYYDPDKGILEYKKVHDLGALSLALEILRPVEVRMPIPHLVDWYENPRIISLTLSESETQREGIINLIKVRTSTGNISDVVNNHVVFEIPYDFGTSFAAIQDLVDTLRVNRSGGGCDPDSEEEQNLNKLQEIINQAAGAAASSMSAKRIEMVEVIPCLYDFFDKDEDILQSEKFKKWEQERNNPPQPPEDDPVVPYPVDDPCDEVPPPPPPPPPEAPIAEGQGQPEYSLDSDIGRYRQCRFENPPEDSIAYFFFLKSNESRVEQELGSSVNRGNLVLTQKKPIKSEHLDWYRPRRERFLSGKLFFKKVLQRSLDNYAADLTPESVDFINTMYDINLENIYKSTQSGIVRQMIENVVNDYTSGDVYSQMLRDISQSADSPFENQQVAQSVDSRYVIERVSFGKIPDHRKKCDTHLLKIKDLIRDELQNFQNDLCLDLEAETANSTPGRPRLTPIEESMLRVCVKTTVRHYVAESIASGLLSYSMGSFDPRGLTSTQAEYIVEKMRQKMNTYNLEYFDEFVIQAYEIYEGNKEGKSYSDVLNKIVKEEYREISEGIRDSVIDAVGSARGILNPMTMFKKSISEVEMKGRSVFRNEQLGSDNFGEFEYGDYAVSVSLKDYRILSGTRGQGENEKFPNSIFVREKYGHHHPDGNVARDELETRYRLCLLIPVGEDIPLNSRNPIQQPLPVVDSNTLTYESNREAGLLGGAAFRKVKVVQGEDLGSQDYIECFCLPLIELEHLTNARISSNTLVYEQYLEYDILTDVCFPLSIYSSMISIHEMETTSAMTDVVLAFAETRASLFTSFQAILPEKDDWDKAIGFIEDQGGEGEYAAKFDFNSQLKAIPCTEYSFNYGLNVCWGNSFDGLGFDFALKAARDAALGILKNYIEMTDPNVKIANALSFLSKLACVNIPPSAYSAVINWSSPWLTTPFTYVYTALGFASFAEWIEEKFEDDDSDEESDSQEQVEFEREVCKNISLERLPEEINQDIIDTTASLSAKKRELDDVMIQLNSMSQASSAEEYADMSRKMQSITQEIVRLENKLEELEIELDQSSNN